jgi:PST family polysaccharide transporter
MLKLKDAPEAAERPGQETTCWKFRVLSCLVSAISSRSALFRILSNTSWLFLDRLLGLVVGFIVGAWVARYLGPAQYGLYSYALAFEAMFVPIAGLGLANVVVREIINHPLEKHSILGTAFAAQLAAGLLTFGLIVGVVPLLRPADPLVGRLVAITAVQLVFRAFVNTLDCWFRSRVQSKYIVWSQSIALAVTALIRVALILLAAPLIAFAWSGLAQVVLFALGAAVSYRMSGQVLRLWQGSLWRARRLLQDSWPLILSGLAVVAYMRIGQLMIGNMLGDEDLGIYSVAVRLSELWYFIPMAVASSVFPAIVNSRENQVKEVYKRRLQSFYDAMAGIAYAVVIPCTLLASRLVTWLFGPDYAEAGPILTVHIWAFVFVSLGVARSQWLIAENLTRVSMFMTILGAVTSLGLNYLLIPTFGGLGAAWATLISYAVSGYVSSVLWKQVRPVFAQLTLSLLVPFRLPLVLRSVREYIS